MVKIKPLKYLIIHHPENNRLLKAEKIVWQGLHTCAQCFDNETHEKWLIDLPVGQGLITPMAINLNSNRLFPPDPTDKHWYATVLKNIVKNPLQEKIEFDVIKTSNNKNAIIINTIDAWYGHSLLYFLHIENLIKAKPKDFALIVLMQPFLKWLLPEDGIDEIWIAKIPLKKGTNFYEELSNDINKQLDRFQEVFISTSPVQPRYSDISKFTKVAPFSFNYTKATPRITFIWREDASRIWCRNWYVTGVIKLLKIEKVFLPFQVRRLSNLFNILNKKLGNKYKFTIAGMGTFGKFSTFIDDKRVVTFNDNVEKELCEIYAESVLVIGVHGSSLILPSAHAGMTISIMPKRRWGNFAQDIYLNENKSIAEEIFDKRILPIEIGNQELADIIENMVTFREGYTLRFVTHTSEL